MGRKIGGKMLKKTTIKLILCFIVVFISLTIIAQEIPSNFSPFVQLRRVVKLSVYKNPIINKNGKILSKGRLINETTKEIQVGSGTIINRQGLVLTNYHVYGINERLNYNKKNATLLSAAPLNSDMRVYSLKNNDPLSIPVFKYLAKPISLDAKHDTAILKIYANSKGNKLDRKNFSFISIANPFSIKFNEKLTIVGYPAKGGQTLTLTEGKFLGYYRNDTFYRLDGFLKTNAAMSPGSSGGAALNKQKIVGVPTAVTSPAMAGSDMGYINPITWAVKGLIVAREKYEFNVSGIPLNWLKSEYNTDETKTRTYVTGKVFSAYSNNPVKAKVIITRSDRTLSQITRVHLQTQALVLVYIAKKLKQSGYSTEQIAKRLKVPKSKAEQILNYNLSKKDLSPEIISYIKGKFYYEITESDNDGFFILSIPRNKKVKLYIVKSGFRSLNKTITTKSGVSQTLGKLKLY